jgi:hypothetical protein
MRGVNQLKHIHALHDHANVSLRPSKRVKENTNASYFGLKLIIVAVLGMVMITD